MKIPSLEEVKDYFKNAKIIRVSGISFEYSGRVFQNKNNFYFDEITRYVLWCPDHGYSMIVSSTKPKMPTLDEVLKHFENAETVKCLEDGDVYVLDFDQKLTIHERSDGRSEIYLQDQIDIPFSGMPSECYLWLENKGFAQILKKKKSNRLEELEKRVEVLEKEKLNEMYSKIQDIFSKQITNAYGFLHFPLPDYAKGGVVKDKIVCDNPSPGIKLKDWQHPNTDLFRYHLQRLQIEKLNNEIEELKAINVDLTNDNSYLFSIVKELLTPKVFKEFEKGFFKREKDA